MKNRDIYNSALRFIGEEPDAEANCDYEERASYLLAAFCTEAAQVDKDYREANELEKASETDCVFLPLEADFPCTDRFATAAAMYLAAMLIIDENIELSDKLFDRYCDIMATIHSEIPAKIEKIAQKYGAY